MKHGEERNRRNVTTYGPVAALATTDGRTVYVGPTSSVTQPVSERYCAHCDAWHTVEGILRQIMGCPSCGQDW